MLKDRRGGSTDAGAALKGRVGGREENGAEGSAAEVFVKEEHLSAQVHQSMHNEQQEQQQQLHQQQVEQHLQQQQQMQIQCFPPPEPHYLRLPEAGQGQGNANTTVRPNFGDCDTMLGKVQTDSC